VVYRRGSRRDGQLVAVNTTHDAIAVPGLGRPLLTSEAGALGGATLAPHGAAVTAPV
jgi:hypothetical protein